MNYSKDGITVAAMLDTRRTKPNEKYPVKIRVTYRRDRRYYPTGKDLTPEEWEMLGATKARALVAVRKDIESSYQIVRAAVENLAGNGGFSLDALNDRLKGAASNTVNAMFRAKIAELEKAGRVGRDPCGARCPLDASWRNTPFLYSIVIVAWRGGGCQAGKRKKKRKSGFWDCQAGICKNILTTICCCIKMRVTNNT